MSPGGSTGPTDVCVLADPYLTEWQVCALERARDRAGVDYPLVVVNDPDDPDIDPDAAADAVNGGIGLETLRLFGRLVKRQRAWALVVAERKLGELLGDDRPLERRHPVEAVDVLANAEVRRVTPLEDGNWTELPPEAVSAVRRRCDVAVRFGFGLLRGDVLTAPDRGVVSFHPADIRRYRGLGPPKAFVDGRRTIGSTLQRLTEEIDGGEIVAEGRTEIDDCATLWDVYDRVHALQIELLAEGLSNLQEPSFEPTAPESLGKYYSTRTLRESDFALRTLAKNLRGRLAGDNDRRRPAAKGTRAPRRSR
ncbi:formyltransferase family protein [Natrialbaceae archaeon GCM10025810]|uniref:formyltransferase family protein n=1 Tax=Halovalidus salilacus TaxID=3075124 RepID=UPI003621498D